MGWRVGVRAGVKVVGPSCWKVLLEKGQEGGGGSGRSCLCCELGDGCNHGVWWGGNGAGGGVVGRHCDDGKRGCPNLKLGQVSKLGI